MDRQDMPAPPQGHRPPPPAVPAPPKRKRRWGRWAVLAAIAALAGFAVYLTTMTGPALDIPISLGIRTGSLPDGASVPKEEEWYGTVEEALATKDYLHDPGTFISEPLAEVPYGGGVARVYFYKDGNAKLAFVVFRFGISPDGRFSPPPSSFIFAVTDFGKQNRFSAKFTYANEAERASQYITDRFFDNLPGPQESFPFFGVSEDPRIKDMTVLGMKPDGVIEYTYEGTTYYFWHYDYDFAGYLLEQPGFSFGDFTLRQVIELLDIRTFDYGQTE